MVGGLGWLWVDLGFLGAGEGQTTSSQSVGLEDVGQMCKRIDRAVVRRQEEDEIDIEDLSCSCPSLRSFTILGRYRSLVGSAHRYNLTKAHKSKSFHIPWDEKCYTEL